MRNISISVNGGKLRGSKHDFPETSVAGCITYDVKALRPDVIRSKMLKVAQKMHHKLCKISAWSTHRFVVHVIKTYGHLHQPSRHGRVLRIFSICDSLKILFYKYMEKFRLVQMYYMSVNETGAIQSLCGRLLGCQMRFLAMRYLEFSKFSKMNIQPLNSSWWRVEWAPEIVHPIKSWKRSP